MSQLGGAHAEHGEQHAGDDVGRPVHAEPHPAGGDGRRRASTRRRRSPTTRRGGGRRARRRAGARPSWRPSRTGGRSGTTGRDRARAGRRRARSRPTSSLRTNSVSGRASARTTIASARRGQRRHASAAAMADTRQHDVGRAEPRHPPGERVAPRRCGGRSTQSWIASSHGSAVEQRRRGPGRRTSAATAGSSQRARAWTRPSVIGGCVWRYATPIALRSSQATTSPMTRSIVTSSRQPTRRFSPCSPIAGSIVTCQRVADGDRRRRDLAADRAGADRPQRGRRGGLAALDVAGGDRERDGRPRAGAHDVGPVLRQLGHADDEAGDRHEDDDEADDAASRPRSPQDRQRVVAAVEQPARRRLDGTEPLGQAVLGGPPGSRPRQPLDDPRQAGQDGAGAEQDGDEHGRAVGAGEPRERGASAPARARAGRAAAAPAPSPPCGRGAARRGGCGR